MIFGGGKKKKLSYLKSQMKRHHNGIRFNKLTVQDSATGGVNLLNVDCHNGYYLSANESSPQKSFNYLNNDFNDGCGGDDGDHEQEGRVQPAPCSYSRYLLRPHPPSSFLPAE